MFEETRYGNALAAGTAVIALIDTLIDKGLISRTEAQGVLIRAAAGLKPREKTIAGAEAIAVIADLMSRYA
jgi:hypothetical protein